RFDGLRLEGIHVDPLPDPGDPRRHLTRSMHQDIIDPRIERLIGHPADDSFETLAGVRGPIRSDDHRAAAYVDLVFDCYHNAFTGLGRGQHAFHRLDRANAGTAAIR